MIQTDEAGAAAATLAAWRTVLAETDAEGATDAGCVDLLRGLEDLKAAAAAAQARVTAVLDASQRAQQEAAGVPAKRQGAGVAAQVGLARRESPVRGAQHLGLAKALVQEMPYTLAALAAGRLSERRATLLVRETACLTREDRRRADAILCADPSRLEGRGDRAVAGAARGGRARRAGPSGRQRSCRRRRADARSADGRHAGGPSHVAPGDRPQPRAGGTGGHLGRLRPRQRGSRVREHGPRHHPGRLAPGRRPGWPVTAGSLPSGPATW